MHKRFVNIIVSGTIAGVIIACGSTVAEKMGDTIMDAGDSVTDAGSQALVDAGEFLVDAGQELINAGRKRTSSQDSGGELDSTGDLLEDSVTPDSELNDTGIVADVGQALKDAGQAITDAGNAMVSDASAQDNEEDDIPRSHWVLRDKDGVPVEAMVSGTCGQDYDAPHYVSCSSNILYGNIDEYPCVLITYLKNKYVNTLYKLETGKPEQCNSQNSSPPEWVVNALPNAPYEITLEY